MKKFELLQELPKYNTESPSEKMLLEKSFQQTCWLQGWPKSSIWFKKKKKKGNQAKLSKTRHACKSFFSLYLKTLSGHSEQAPSFYLKISLGARHCGSSWPCSFPPVNWAQVHFVFLYLRLTCSVVHSFRASCWNTSLLLISPFWFTPLIL